MAPTLRSAIAAAIVLVISIPLAIFVWAVYYNAIVRSQAGAILATTVILIGWAAACWLSVVLIGYWLNGDQGTPRKLELGVVVLSTLFMAWLLSGANFCNAGLAFPIPAFERCDIGR